MSKNKFYVIYKHNKSEVILVDSLTKAENLRKGNKNALSKGFKTLYEAENWIQSHNYRVSYDEKIQNENKNNISLENLLSNKEIKEKFIYFLSNIDDFLKKKEQFDKMLIIPKKMRENEVDDLTVGIWKPIFKKFDNFCNNYSNYSKTDILSYALFEFLNKYDITDENADNWIKELCCINKEDDRILFFDMGTGRGIGAEVRVTNSNGDSILYKLENHSNLLINEFGNINLGNNVSTLYGELYAFYLALLIVDSSTYYKAIAGDNINALKCYFESHNTKNFSHYELDLINAILKLKEKINEKINLEIFYVSGDINPADLGFHRK